MSVAVGVGMCGLQSVAVGLPCTELTASRESLARHSRIRSLSGSVAPGFGHTGLLWMSNTDQSTRITKSSVLGTGNDRTPGRANAGMTEPGKFGLSVCLFK